MQNGNHKTDSWLGIDGSTVVGAPRGTCRTFAGTARRSAGGLLWSVMIAASLLISARPALGQFAAEPMKLEIQVTPGKRISSVINLRSYNPDAAVQLDLSVVELSQSQDGQWLVVDPNGIKDPNSPCFGFDVSRLSSCKSWIRLDKTTVTLDPAQVVPLEVTLRVPRGLRGFYTAGIIASMTSRSSQPGIGVSMVMQLLVPVIVEIEGRSVVPRIEATGVGMEFRPAGGAGKATTTVSINIDNNGGTFSRLHPIVRIWSFSGGFWRVITTKTFEEQGIIPGAKLTLKAPLGKSLPAGKYRLAGEIYVDGRRQKRLQKDIDFVGDPKVTTVAADKPLDLEPLDITIESMPGTTRTGTVKVINGADATVNVRTALGLPPVLQQTNVGDVKGEDLDCTTWLKVIPEQFTLQGEGGRQNIQIVATMPNPVATHPCYYAMLALWATYPDGQQAGVTTMPVCIRNTTIQAEPGADGLKININELGKSKFLVAATFANQKAIHFAPITVRAGVLPSTDTLGIPRTSTFLTGDASLWLPFEMRQYSGVLDLSGVSADVYTLVGRLEYAPGKTAHAWKIIRVSIEGGERVVETLGTQDETGGTVIKW
jgi:hypothetical protein